MEKPVNTYWKTNLKYLSIPLSIWFLVSFGGGTSEDWWFGVSPEGFGTLAMCANILIAILISYRTPAPPKEVQLMVDEIRKP